MTTKKKILSLVLVIVLALLCCTVTSCKWFNKDKGDPDTQDKPDEPTKTQWPEAGVYYFDDVNGENTLTLNVGDTFSLTVKGTTSTGKYTLTETKLELDFDKEGVENVIATYEGNVITLTYENANMRFLKKLNFTVSFNTNGGSAIDAQTVVNGKSATKPQADPTRENFVFVGWYADAEFKASYVFGTPVTSDITVFARWTEKSAGGEYTVNLDENYDGAAAPTAVTTKGAKLFDLPTPEREGYTFAGWWFRVENKVNGETRYELSNEYTNETLKADTTLYALWIADDTGSQLKPAIVNVTGTNITWTAVTGARSYDVKVIGPDGETVLDTTTAATTLNLNFANYDAGVYEIIVTALAQSGEQNNSVTYRYFLNKPLDKVTGFNVVDNNLTFNAVANAEKYLVTVVCGNADHNHTLVDNGTSTTFDFTNCTMTKDGIKFTVTAVADGFAPSTSDVFTHTKVLAGVDGFSFDEATQTLTWNSVASAECYMVSVKLGSGNEVFVNFGAQTFVSLKDLAAGEIVVKVYPKAHGYASPDAAEYTYNKAVLATPSGLLLKDGVLTWAPVAGAEKYVVTVNGTETETTETSFNLTANGELTVTVRAKGATESAATDAIVVNSGELKNVAYANGLLTWAPVLGADYYELQINGGDVVKLENGEMSSPVTFTKEGENTVALRFVDGATTSEFVTVTVTAYRVVFDTIGGNEIADMFKAVGDPMNLESAKKAGYNFVAWYNLPGGASANGAPYTDELFAGNANVTLYAYYKAQKFTVTYNYGAGGEGTATNDEVAFGSNYQLTVPTSFDVAGVFGGWFDAPYGNGTRYTDETGKSVMPWADLEGKDLYAFWVDNALSFTLTKVNGKDVYAVSKGSRIDLASIITVPSTFRGLPVAYIAGNAFANCTNLKVINLPETIQQISDIAPFAGCSSLTEINVYDVDGVADPVFSSVDGVLLENGTDGAVKLALVPMAKEGTFRIPAGVTEIPEAAFAGSKISKVIITPEVTTIGREAFKNCTKLESVVFEVNENNSVDLKIGTRAFMNCTALESITLPARLTEIKLQKYALVDGEVDLANAENAFSGCINLKTIEIADNNNNYKSVDNVIFSKDSRYLLFAPDFLTGTYTVPEGTRNVSAGAFVGCNYLEAVVLPGTLVLVGDCSFYGLDTLSTVTFNSSFDLLTVGKYAFKNCKSLTNLVFDDNCGVKELGEGAFMGCTALTEVTIPASMTTVGAFAFADCSDLETINFATSTNDLAFGENAFENCTSLTTVNLPANVTALPGVFVGCESLTEVNIIGESQYFESEDGVLYTKGKTEILFFPKGKTGEFTLPATVTTINNGVFQGVKLDKIVISNAITLIGDDAFNNAEIGTFEFTGEATGSLVIGANAFNGATIGTLELPAHTASIGESAFYKANVTNFALNEGLTTLGDYAFWGAELDLVLPATVKTVGAYCFSGEIESGWWSNTFYGPSVTFAQNSVLETIGDRAFEGNTNISELVIPASVKTIGHYAFYDCSELESVTFGQNSVLESIGAYAFAELGIYDITIPGSVKTIGAYAFHGSELETVIFEEGAEDLYLGSPYVYTRYNESMGSDETDIYRGHVFADCDYLEKVVLPSRLTVLEVDTFYYAGYRSGSLDVTIGVDNAGVADSRLTTIGDECFYGSKLTSFIIPASVQNLDPVINDSYTGESYDRLGIGNRAFYGLYSTFTSVEFVLGGDLPLTIGENAFDNVAKITQIKLPARLDYYTSYTGDVIAPLANGAQVFNSCDALEAVYIEDKAGSPYTSYQGVLMTSDRKEVIYYPMGRQGAFTVPSTVTVIHDYAFAYASGLPSITFEGGTEDMTIGEYAFQRCSGLTNVILSDNVVSLGERVFYDCESLESLTLSKKLQSFDASSMVESCDNLAQINVGTDGSNQGENFASVNGVLYSADKTVLVAYPIAKTDEEVVVDANVKVIAAGAFASNEYIKKVVLPEGLVEIQKGAFDYCDNLEEVNIPSTVQLIGENAFRYCYALSTVTFAEGGDDLLLIQKSAFERDSALTALALPARVYSIGNNAFFRTGLADLTIGQNSALTSIGDYAFSETHITQIAVPAGVTKIGNYAFYKCSSLLSITMDEGLISVGDHAFAGCESLVSIRFPASLQTLGESVFYECYNSSTLYKCSSLESVTFAPGSQLEKIPAGTFAYTALKSFTVPANVTVIEGVDSVGDAYPSAFYNVATLETVLFEDGSKCTEIGGYTFANTGLKEITLPTSLSTIGTYAFYYCRALESIVIPETVTNLGDGAFWGCTSLASVDLKTKATMLPDDLFYGCSVLDSIVIPANVSVIGSDCFKGTALAAIDVEEGSLYFKSIDGILYTADGTGIVMIPANKVIVDFVVPNTVTTIGDKLFYELETLETLVFEGGRTEYLTIGNMAFAKCYNLRSVVFTEMISSVGEEAFYDCMALSSVTIASDMTESTFGYDAFYYCTSLVEICNKSSMTLEPEDGKCQGLTDSAIRIYSEGESAIAFNNGFTTLTMDGEVYLISYSGSETDIVIPEGVTVIYSNAFYNSDLNSVTLASTVKEIMDAAFADSSIKTVVLNEGLEKIGEQAFYYASSITTIKLPSTLKEIADYAFYYSGVRGVVAMPDSLEYVGYRAFYNSQDITFLVSAPETPDGWDSSWYRSGYGSVLWGYTGENITYTFVTNGGSAVDSITSAEPITMPEGPTYDGYIFNGWYDNAEFEGEAITGVYYNGTKTTLYAKWMTQEEFEATFAGTAPEYAIDATNGASHTANDTSSGSKLYLYFKVVATEDVTLTITTVSGVDTVIRIYDNPSDAQDAGYYYVKSQDGYDDDEVLTYTFAAGTTYYIVTYAYSSSFTGEYGTTITVG